jgi:hypothetical protein
MTRTLPGIHKKRFQGNSSGRLGAQFGGPRAYPPDHDAFEVGFSMLLTMLGRIATQIRELDDTLSSLIDESDDEEEILHATGELFAAKSIYINLVAGIEPLETSRVRATESGVSSGEFFEMIRVNGDIPQIQDPYSYGYGQGSGILSAGSITSSTLAGSNLMYNAKVTVPSVSATPPVAPLLP